MSKILKIERVLRLPAPPSKVWTSLVCPALENHYQYNCEVAATSTPDAAPSSLEQCPTFKPGDILEYEKGRSVKFSTFDPKAGVANHPQNYLHISYKLTAINEGTELQVTIENLMEEADRYQHSQAGWANVVAPRLEKMLTEDHG